MICAHIVILLKQWTLTRSEHFKILFTGLTTFYCHSSVLDMSIGLVNITITSTISAAIKLFKDFKIMLSMKCQEYLRELKVKVSMFKRLNIGHKSSHCHVYIRLCETVVTSAKKEL